jgi:hypothetical protein
MNAVQFHQWATTATRELSSSNQEPDSLLEAVTHRLALGQSTLDTTVLLAFGASATWDGQHGQAYRRTFGFAEQCISLSPGRAELWALLRKRMADLYASTDDLASAQQLRAAAHRDLLAAETYYLQRRIENQVEAGMEALRRRDKADAEQHFLSVMSFNWTVVEDAQAFHHLRGLYVRAAYGLIQARAGDAAALRNIFFIPATIDELQPLLDQAIEAAER